MGVQIDDMAVLHGLGLGHQRIVQHRLGAFAGLAHAGIAVDHENPVGVLFKDIFIGNHVAAVETVVDALLDRGKAQLGMDPAHARGGTIGPQLAAIGDKDQRGAGMRRDLVQMRDLGVQLSHHFGGAVGLAKDLAQRGDVLVDRGEQIVAKAQIHRRQNLRHFRIGLGRARAHHHQIRAGCGDRLVIRLKDRTDDRRAGGVFLQVIGQVAAQNTGRLRPHGIGDVQRVDVKDQHLGGRARKLRLALRMRDGHRIGRCRQRQHQAKRGRRNGPAEHTRLLYLGSGAGNGPARPRSSVNRPGRAAVMPQARPRCLHRPAMSRRASAIC